MIPSAKPQAENEPKQAWMIALVAVATAGSVYMAEKQKKEQKEQVKDAKKEQARQMAEAQQMQLQAGEYWEDINTKQALLQVGENRFKTLTDLLLMKVQKSKSGEGPVYTTPVNPPAQQNVSVIDKINQGIDKILRG